MYIHIMGLAPTLLKDLNSLTEHKATPKPSVVRTAGIEDCYIKNLLK
jgi:hypothetical protein